MLVIKPKQKQHPSPKSRSLFFCRDLFVLVTLTEWQEYFSSSHCCIQLRGVRHWSHTQLFLIYIFFFFPQSCHFSGLFQTWFEVHGRPWHKRFFNNLQNRRATKYPCPLSFHSKMCGETERRGGKNALHFPPSKRILLCFPLPLLILRDLQDSIFVCVWSRLLETIPASSGCSSDLNGTGQGYVQSVCGLLYAMIRWLLRSLMSGGGTSSFFTGVDDSVERLPLGLNKSDTKNTMQ